MEDKTPLYIIAIVCIVALVAVISMITRSGAPSNSNTYSGNGITANVIAEEAEPLDLSTIGRVLFGITLIGAFVYMYTKW